MFDIHCHIIYGVDDGSMGLEESLRMARLAYSGGTDAIIATPHCNVPGSYRNFRSTELDGKLKEINSRLIEDGEKIRVFPGQEIFCAGSFTEDLKSGRLMTLNFSRYPLVEFDFSERGESVETKLGSLLAEGYVPIVAHPERYAFVQESTPAAYRLRSLGCLLQVNKGSLGGAFGDRARRSAHRLMEEELADFIASDAHSPYVRNPYLADVYEMVCEEYSYDYAKLLMEDNPLKVLRDEEI